MEYKMKCNVCGQIFCYTDEDLKKNASNAGMAALSSLGSLASTLGGGTVFHTHHLQGQADRYSDKVVDYNQCPNCHSRDISIYTGDIKATNNTAPTLDAPVAKTVNINSSASTDSLLKRVFLFLEDGDWASANSYCEACLDVNPELAEAYLAKLMVEKHAHSIEELGNCKTPLTDSKNYQKVIRYGNDVLVNQLKLLAENSEKSLRRLAEFREKLADPDCSVMLSVSDHHVAAICADGSIQSCGKHPSEIYDAQKWKNLRCIGTGYTNTVGLRADGTVVACGEVDAINQGVARWKDITAISIGGNTAIGLCTDGTVVACGSNKEGQCNVGKWKNIISIANDSGNTFGLSQDGTVKWCGEDPDSWTYVPNLRNVTRIKRLSSGGLGVFYSDGKADIVSNRLNKDVTNWNQVQDVQSVFSGVIGLKNDGTVYVAKGSLASMGKGDADVDNWSNIVAIEVGAMYTVGLKADGTVVATGANNWGQCNVSGWENIVAIKADCNLTVGLRADGSVVSCGVGCGGVGEVDCSGLKLFNDIADLDANIARNRELRIAAEEAAEERRIAEKKAAEEKRQARIAELEKEKQSLQAEIPNIKGIFAGSKKRKIEAQIAEIDAELDKLMR